MHDDCTHATIFHLMSFCLPFHAPRIIISPTLLPDNVISLGSLEVLKENKSILMKSLNSKPIFNISLDNVAQCVVPTLNRNELEIQFNENDNRKDDDSLVQITFHFPKNPAPEDSDDDDDEAEQDTKAELLQKSIVETGAISDITGSVLVEFSREEGNFVAPRAKFVVQVHFLSKMICIQYFYRILLISQFNIFQIDLLLVLNLDDGNLFPFEGKSIRLQGTLRWHQWSLSFAETQWEQLRLCDFPG